MQTSITSHTPSTRPVVTNGMSLPDWRQFLTWSDAELAQYDIAVLNLACAVGLPESEQIDVPGCLRWQDAATDCVRRWTDAGLEEFFRPNPTEYNNSKAYFRMFGMVMALQKHCGVRYDPSKTGAGPEVPFAFHEQFIHGVIQGPGGTCATLPVVYASIGRRLGYPMRLSCTKRHLFARWDDSNTGERLNVECAGEGFYDPPDDYYRGWPEAVNAEEEQRFGYLRSFTPRQELASFIGQRGHVLADHKRYRQAMECFAEAVELTPGLATYPQCVMTTIVLWKKHLQSQYPPRFPRRFNVLMRPDRRRWKDMPWEVEKEIAALIGIEHCLNDPLERKQWWDPLRQGRRPLTPVPSAITIHYDALFPNT